MYRHTQIGWAILVASLVVLPVAYLGIREGDLLVFALPAGIVAVVVALFGTLTVDVDHQRFALHFGLGLIRRRIPLKSIRAFVAVRTPWYYGWGVRFTPYGMLYNVSGLSAVELLLHDGRRVRVGTDQPEALLRALEMAAGTPRVSSVAEFPKDPIWRRRTRLIALAIVVPVVLLVAWMFYAHLQPPVVTMTPGAFAVTSGWYRREVPIAAITSVSLIDSLPRIVRRTNGFAAGGTLRGNFRLEEWGSGQLFINHDVPPYVVVRTRESYIVVNFADPELTRDLYDRLRRP